MSPRAASVLRWSLLALAGLAVAIAVGVAAASLTSNQIGLSEEPVRAGEALAPKSRGEDGGHDRRGDERGRGGDSTTTGTTTASIPETTSTSDGLEEEEGEEGEEDD